MTGRLAEGTVWPLKMLLMYPRHPARDRSRTPATWKRMCREMFGRTPPKMTSRTGWSVHSSLYFSILYVYSFLQWAATFFFFLNLNCVCDTENWTYGLTSWSTSLDPTCTEKNKALHELGDWIFIPTWGVEAVARWWSMIIWCIWGIRLTPGSLNKGNRENAVTDRSWKRQMCAEADRVTMYKTELPTCVTYNIVVVTVFLFPSFKFVFEIGSPRWPGSCNPPASALQRWDYRYVYLTWLIYSILLVSFLLFFFFF